MKKIAIAKLLLSSLLLFPLASYAQELPNEHPIDKFFSSCKGLEGSTAEAVECVNQAEKMWDKELNRVYRALNQRLKPAGKKDLLSAQKSWIKYRDAEFKRIDSMFEELSGTMYVPMQAYRRMQILKTRTLELDNDLKFLQEHQL